VADQGKAAARVGPYAWYALGVLVLVYILNFIDRQILSILAEDIKRDLALDDAQLGFLYGTAFAVFYALFGIPLARLADSWYRGRLMAIGLGVWSGMTALSGLSTSYAQLAAARVGVGIGEASASPAAYSMIADYFPARRRATALSIYSAGLYIGGGLSLPIGGLVLSHWNAAYPSGGPFGLVGWQAAFLAVGIPGLLLALWVLSLREPLRGAVDGLNQPIAKPGAWSQFGRELMAILPPLTLVSTARIPGALKWNLIGLAAIALVAWAMVRLTGSTVNDRAQWTAIAVGIYAVFSWVQSLRHRDAPTYRLTFGSPVFVLAVIGFGSIAFITYALGFWAAPYLERTFYAGPTAPGVYLTGTTAKIEIATILGWTAAITSAAGVILGGVVSDWWRQRDPRGRLFVSMLAVVLPIPAVLVLYTTDSLSTFYLVNPIATTFGAAWVGASVATLQDLVLPRMRATAGAAYVLGTTMIGLALGPYYAGKMAIVMGSLEGGILSLFAMTPVTLVLLWLVSRRIAVTEATKVAHARAAGEIVDG